MKTLKSSLSLGISKSAQTLPFSFRCKQIYSLTFADLCRLQYGVDYVQTPRLIASENILILLKINANMDIRIIGSHKRLLSVSCLVICHKGNCCSVRGWVFANEIITSIKFQLRGFKNILIEKGRNRPDHLSAYRKRNRQKTNQSIVETVLVFA